MDSRTELSPLETIKGAGEGLLASVITTFNAYLPFYEQVILPKLRAGGARHNLVLMDASEFTRLMAEPDTAPRLAGRGYTLVPITGGGSASSSPGAFHPKLMLLLGKNKAILHVGSHNLTLSGFSHNAEMTALLSESGGEVNTFSEIAQAWQATRHWVQREHLRLPPQVAHAVQATERVVPWLGRLRTTVERTGLTATRLLIQGEGTPSLWDQVEPHLNVPSRFSSAVVVGAFFDRRLAVLKKLEHTLPGVPLRIAIQPGTVHLPCTNGLAAGFDWRDASHLRFAIEEADSDEAAPYLHAKAVWLQGRRAEDDLLLVGSANPSAPAWLSSGGVRNDEVMVLLHGTEARTAAQGLGLAAVSRLPVVTAEVLRRAIARSGEVNEQRIGGDAEQDQQDALLSGACVCAWVDNELRIRASTLPALPTSVTLIDVSGEMIGHAVNLRRRDEDHVADMPESVQIAHVCRVRYAMPSRADILAVVHRVADIEDLSRSGAQQALRTALDGIETDGSDLSALVAVVERAIFSNIDTELPQPGKGLPGRESKSRDQGPDPSRPDSLVVPMKEMRAPRTPGLRPRLLAAGSDLAHLLDVLFRGLRIESAEAADPPRDPDHGDTDPGQGPHPDPRLPQVQSTDDAAIADLCRKKVRSLVKRAVRVVDEAVKLAGPDQPEDPRRWWGALVKLTAVMALLRELRVVEQLPRWRAVYAQLVDQDALIDLLFGVMSALFGRDTTLVRRVYETLGGEHFEELARLKGLLLWLAWESEVKLVTSFSQMDEHDVLLEKVQDKSVLLEIAQYLPGDELSLKEARQSILRCASAAKRVSAARWLEQIELWCQGVDELLLHGRGKPKLPGDTCVGDLAFVNGQPHVRVVCAKDRQYVSLVDWGAEDAAIVFASDRVMGLELALLQQTSSQPQRGGSICERDRCVSSSPDARGIT
jgi:hypothetical protein